MHATNYLFIKTIRYNCHNLCIQNFFTPFAIFFVCVVTLSFFWFYIATKNQVFPSFSNPNPVQPGTNYVKVTVEHHFRSDSDVTFTEFEAKHAGYLQLTQGKFSESFSAVPNSLVQQNQTCSAESMARLSADFFVVTGLEDGPVTIGNYIEVTCEREIQKFTRDIWDGNSTDNKLTIISQPNRAIT